MLSAAPAASPQGIAGAQARQPIVPPSREVLMKAFHDQSYVVSALRGLLGKPNLADRDVLNAVGAIVADEIMSSFQAATYLKDLPNDAEPLQLRQWVGQHFALASQHLQTVAEMIAAEGAMVRRRRAQQLRAMFQPRPQQSPQNMLSLAPAPAQVPGAGS
jgi:hypothetical protein